MTKRKKNQSLEMPLFDWIKKSQQLSTELPPRGSLNIDAEFRAAVSEDLRHAVDETGWELSRAEVAARMTEYAGEDVTDTRLYNWTAESKDGHSFPARLMPAFVYATRGQRRALEVISRHSGVFVLPGPEVLRAEMQKIDEEIKVKRDEKNKRRFLLKELENGTRK